MIPYVFAGCAFLKACKLFPLLLQHSNFGAMVDSYPYLTGAARREAIWRDYGLSLSNLTDKILPFKVRAGNPPVPLPAERIVERHPLNNRQYDDLAEEYAQRFEQEGYSNNDAGAIHLMSSDERNVTFRALGGATRCEMAILVAVRAPDHPNLIDFLRTGGFKCVYYSHRLPEELQVLLVEELNDKNELGCSNTIMQKVNSVPRYMEMFCAFNDGENGDHIPSSSTAYGEAQWLWLKQRTSLYASEIEWKKTQSLYQTLMGAFIPRPNPVAGSADMSLLEFMDSFYRKSVSILKMQQLERTRNLPKYLSDLLAKFLPLRVGSGKGKGERYPELAAIALTFSLISKDSTPHLLLNDALLGNLVATCSFSDDAPQAANPKAKAKSKRRARVLDAEADAKVGVNKLDQIEDMINAFKQKLATDSTELQHDVVAKVRSKLLEFVFRNTAVDVTVVQNDGKRTQKKLKTLPEAIAHFSKYMEMVHLSAIAANVNFEMPEQEVEGSAGGENCGGDASGDGPAFSIPVGMEIIRNIGMRTSHSWWFVRPHAGTNMTKRLQLGANVEVKNNAVRRQGVVAELVREDNANVGELIKTITRGLHGEALAEVSAGFIPGTSDLAEVVKVMESSMCKYGGATEKSFVAFKLKFAAEDLGVVGAGADGYLGQAGDATAAASERCLKARKSDAVDVSDGKALQALKELVSNHRKHGDNIAQHEYFAKIMVDVARSASQDRSSVAHTLGVAVDAVLRFVPRELDYIVKADLSIAKISGGVVNLSDVRRRLFVEVSAFACGASNVQVATRASESFLSTLELHDFPRCALDVQSFVWDSWL